MRKTVFRVVPSGAAQKTVNALGREFSGEISYMQANAGAETIKIALRRDAPEPELTSIIRRLDSVAGVKPAESIFAL